MGIGFFKEKIRDAWRNPIFWFAIFAVIIFSVWYLYIPSDNNNKADALSALFTALAFAAMTTSLWLQRQELKDTRKELRKTAVANAKSAKISANNLRAQYLFWWLKENTEKKRKYYNRLLKKEYAILSTGSRYALFKTKNGLSIFPPDNLEFLEQTYYHFCMKYLEAENELQRITKLQEK